MSSDKHPDAIALLKADHRAVEGLFEKFEKTKNSEKKNSLAQTICMALTIHTMIEEEIFYPACQGKIESDKLGEAYVEHDSAKVLVAELLQGEAEDDFFDAKMKVLSEDIKHHVKEEERPGDGLFALAKKADLDIASLGLKLQARKEALKSEFEHKGATPPKTLTFSASPAARGKRPLLA